MSINNFENYLVPVWEGRTVFGKIIFDESIMPVTEADGKILPIPLLYHPEKIISVKSATLEKTYTEGKDYILQDGKIVIPKGSDITVTRYEDYILTEEKRNELCPDYHFICVNGGYLMFGDWDYFHKRQTVITYTHDDCYSDQIGNFIAEHTKKKLPRISKLLNDSSVNEINVGFYGDSITFGCNSSGHELHMSPPFVPIWARQVTEKLEKDYLKKINCINRAVGGKDSLWGLQNVSDFKNDKLDLFILAFGMNDATCGMANSDFSKNISGIIEKIKEYSPCCEIIIVSTTLPNKLSDYYKAHEEYEAVLQKIAYGKDFITLAPMTSLHKLLLNKKRYSDMTGNNINHPNDFLARIYAMLLLKILENS